MADLLGGGYSVEQIEDIAGTTLSPPLSYDDANDLMELLYGNPFTLTSGNLDVAVDGIENSHIAADAVDTTQVVADAITNALIAADAITGTEIAPDAVGSTQIASNSVDGSRLTFDPVVQTELGNHAGNPTAHHAKPTGTQSAGASGGYLYGNEATHGALGTIYAPGSQTWAASVPFEDTLIDGVEFDITLRSENGNPVGATVKLEGYNAASAAWEILADPIVTWDGTSTSYVTVTGTTTFTNRQITDVRVTLTVNDADCGYNGWSVAPHAVNLPSHSHTI